MNRLLPIALFVTACVSGEPDAAEPQSPATAAAQTTAAQTPQHWTQGISEEDKQRANAEFAEGNQLFAHADYVAAAVRYRAALAIWDHPLIQFNLAVTLIKLEQFAEASQAITRALRFGEEPFTPAIYASALDYQKLLETKTQR